jgi:hypothetical protein
MPAAQTETDVESYAGGRYPDRPRSFTWERELLAVHVVDREWRTPQTLVFDVQTADGRRFRLTYLTTCDSWRAEPLDSLYAK